MESVNASIPPTLPQYRQCPCGGTWVTDEFRNVSSSDCEKASKDSTHLCQVRVCFEDGAERRYDGDTSEVGELCSPGDAKKRWRQREGNEQQNIDAAVLKK